MEDYKELIERLRTHSEYADLPFSWQNEAYAKAADAIEQLVKERDAAIADLSKVGECCMCKHYCETGDEDCAYVSCCDDNFEWRGVQDGTC